MATDILRALLQKGYFPKELPPTFTTRDFGTHSESILADWQSNELFRIDTKLRAIRKGVPRRGAYSYRIDPAEPEIISKPKRGFERRELHITHPLPQALLAAELSKNWRVVQRWLSRQMFSEDEIRVSNQFERSIKGINFAIHAEKKLYLEAAANWLVVTDITRFYPSIYTHSIAWAAYGKENVKRALNLYTGCLADRLDLLVRCCNRNQTVGIPIGPETSRIIAAIISARIDNDFQRECSQIGKENIDRLQDDWTIGVDTYEMAEKTLSAISKVYHAYGLDINGSKTAIERIATSHSLEWKSEIGAFLAHGARTLSSSRLKAFLDLCTRLQSKNLDAPVISYALSVIESSAISQTDVPDVESFLLKAAVIAPNAMDKICRVMLNVQHQTKLLSRRRICERFLRLIEFALDKGNTFEAIWLLYTIRGLKRQIDCRKIFAQLTGLQSSALALILLDMQSKGLAKGRLPVDYWMSEISEESILTNWTWLLAYEGFRNGWLHDTNNLMTKPFFQPLAMRNVVFYDPNRNIVTSKKAVKARNITRQQERREAGQHIELLRRVELLAY